MFVRPIVTVGAVVLTTAGVVAIGPRPARAAWATYGTFAASGGYTDNALFVSEPLPGEPDATGPEADSFAELRPAVVAVTQGSRSRMQASYAFTTQVYQGHEDANSYQHEAQVEYLYLLSAQSDTSLNLVAVQGERSIAAITAPGQVVGQIPGGRIRTLELRAGEGFAHRFRSPWELHQNLIASTVRPLGDYAGPTFYSFDNTFDIMRDYNTSAWGVTLNTNYAVSGDSEFMGTTVPGTKFLFNRLLLTHRRDLSESWNLSVGLGVMQVADGSDPSIAIYEPSGALGLEYVFPRSGTVMGAQYDHSAGASTYTGEVVLTDTARSFLRMDLMPDHELHLEASAGYTFARTFSILDQIVGDRTDIINGAANLTWNIEDNLAIGMSVSALRQIPREEPSPITNARDLRRNQVLLTVTGTVGASARRRAATDASRDTRNSDARDLIDGGEDAGGDGRR